MSNPSQASLENGNSTNGAASMPSGAAHWSVSHGTLGHLINMTATGTYQATLTWPDASIDLDLYLATTSCTTYPPINCLLAVSDASRGNTERIQYPVRNGEQYRLWVDNFTDRATSFSVEHFIAGSDTFFRQRVERGAAVEHGAGNAQKRKLKR